MVFARIFRWLANYFSGSTVPLASTTQSLGLPIQIVTKYDNMANVTVRAIQSVKPHVPLIKFPRDRPQPKFASKIGGINVPTAPKPSQSQSSVATSSTGDSFNKPPIGTTPRGSGIDETHLQANFRRKNLTLDEIEAINSGGRY